MKNEIALKNAEVLELLANPSDFQKQYLDSLNKDQISRIQKSAASRRHGLHSTAPTICMGPVKCPFIEFCPIPPRQDSGQPIYYENAEGSMVQEYGPNSDYPIAMPCIMESLYMQEKQLAYIQHLEVDVQNPIEMSIISELALIDLYKNRALMILSRGDKRGEGRDFISHSSEFDSETGVESVKSVLHPVSDMIDKLEKRRVGWLDRLVETRKSKIELASKLGTKDTNSKLLNELHSLKEALEKAGKDSEVFEISLDD